MLVNPNPNPNINSNPNFERRVDEICEGLQPYIKRHLLEKISPENASMIIEYVHALRMETNLSLDYDLLSLDIDVTGETLTAVANH